MIALRIQYKKKHTNQNLHVPSVALSNYWYFVSRGFKFDCYYPLCVGLIIQYGSRIGKVSCEL